jgi:hypothetical protein
MAFVRLLAAVAASVVVFAAPAGAQAIPAADRPILHTVSGYLERADNGAYFLTTVDPLVASFAPGSIRIVSMEPRSLSRIQVVGLLPPGLSLRPFIEERVELTGILTEMYGERGTPVLEMLDWSRLSWLPPGVRAVEEIGPCICA